MNKQIKTFETIREFEEFIKQIEIRKEEKIDPKYREALGPNYEGYYNVKKLNQNIFEELFSGKNKINITEDKGKFINYKTSVGIFKICLN